MLITLGFIAGVGLVYYYQEHLLLLIHSHFGTNHSRSESDTDNQKSLNHVDGLYNKMIYANSQALDEWSLEVPTRVEQIHVKNLTKQRFIELTRNFRDPLIIRGFSSESDACRHWTLDTFDKLFGYIELPVIKDASIENHKEYVKNHTTDYKYMTFGELIENIRKGKKCYLNNVSRIFGLCPSLLNEMNLDDIKYYTGVDLQNSPNVTHMFMGGKNTGSTLHSSITGNFFIQVRGTKRWILINPKYSRYLMPKLSKTGLFAVSHIDILNATDKDPIMNVPRYDFELHEGDLLFNPPWWWHAVRNESKYVIGCANRFTNWYVALRNNPSYTLTFFSHPISNWNDFNFKTKKENNLKFDQALLRDIFKESNKIT